MIHIKIIGYERNLYLNMIQIWIKLNIRYLIRELINSFV